MSLATLPVIARDSRPVFFGHRGDHVAQRMKLVDYIMGAGRDRFHL